MKRTFITTNYFDKAWQALGLSDSDLIRLEKLLLKNPEAGAVIQGTNGARKIRLEYAGKGKSGGARIIYVDIVVKEAVYLLMAYSKGTRENISADDKKVIAKLISELKREV